MIQLNGVSLPAPASLAVRIQPRAGTTDYTTLGTLVQDGVREKRTVEIGWRRLSGADLSLLANQLNGGFFTCTYPDPLAGAKTIRCRAVDQSARVYQYKDGAPLWADVKITLEEQ